MVPTDRWYTYNKMYHFIAEHNLIEWSFCCFSQSPLVEYFYVNDRISVIKNVYDTPFNLLITLFLSYNTTLWIYYFV